MTNENWDIVLRIANVFGVFISPVLIGAMIRLSDWRAQKSASNAAAKAEIVGLKLLQVSTSQTVQLNTIHILVNHSLGVVMRDLAIHARRVAQMTGDPKDAAIATAAEASANEHDARQEIVDKAETSNKDGIHELE